ncbi:hypothetical protein [Arcticibacterium luteifluviistationis]|uniref:Lipoprotein n=1 Tax=Arcticibacterium luteifluviistationis TaxID=1784714 RepID=A0A2Z4GEW7_9BACT|nr:hypothetical protein [Arcticibacterium luteifluviistationis]AWV99575.1 hypothetical protein DJ013_15920 [Arcticibacterium luteifluviistationis]
MKTLLLLGVVACLSLGCKKTSVLNPVNNNCEKNADDYTAALTAFANEQSKSNCESLKTTLTAAVNSCALGWGVDASDYEELDCSQY